MSFLLRMSLFFIHVGNELPPGLTDKLSTVGDWVVSILGWAAGIAFVAVGGVFLYAYFSGQGSGRAIRALAGVAAGCLIIFAGAAIADTLTGQDSNIGPTVND